MRRKAVIGVQVALAVAVAAAGAGQGEKAVALVEALRAGRFEEVVAAFDDAMRRELPAERLAAVWRGVTEQAGEVRELGPPRLERAGGYRVVAVPVRFERARLDVRVAFDGEGRVAGLHLVPAAPQPTPEPTPAGVVERELVIGDPPWRLPATLTLPPGDGPFLGVVLVAGSGPQDRDETVGPNRPFADLARGLAAHGIASLRYDKRTLRYPERCAEVKGFTLDDEVVADARAAVRALAARPEVDAARVFVVGHSLGGTAAPRIVAAGPPVAGIVILAGPSRPLDDVLVDQVRRLAELDGTVTPAERDAIAAAEAARRRIRDPGLRPEDTVTVLGAPTPGSYWLDLRSYDPVEVARRLDVPILVLRGARDLRVTAADMAGWEKLAGEGRATVKTYPELDHLFIRREGSPAAGTILEPGHVDEGVIREIARFVAGGGGTP